MINWLKQNWLVLVIVTVIVFIGKSGNIINLNKSTTLDYAPMAGRAEIADSKMAVSSTYYPGRQVAPSDSANRITIYNSSLSLQVKDVTKTIGDIESIAKSFGGFLVDSYLSQPDSAASGNITVRIPEDKRSEAMATFKQMAIKVVSVSDYGTDVTDQYVDLQAQLDVLLQTKQKFQEILDKATQVNDLLNVQQQLINLQSQIDSIKGQQKYFEQSAKLTKITVYLSTDELALPYAPTNEWRPAVIFKEAVRSLINNLRGLGNLFIWGFVYLPILIPAYFLYRWWTKRRV